MNFIVTLSVIIVIFLIIKKYIKGKTWSRENAIPPGPFPWPIIGNSLQISESPHIKLTNMARTYGPIMSLRLGTHLVVVGSSVKAATEILKTHDSALSARHLTHSHPSSSPKYNRYYVGFAKECDEQWRYMRSVCRGGLFSGRVFERQVEIRERNVAKMVEYLREMEGEVVNMSEIISTVSLNIMCNALFSRDVFGFGSDSGDEFKDLIKKFLNLLGAPNVANLFPIIHGWDIQGIHKKATKINEKIFKMWQKIVEERREKKSEGVRLQQDFLDSLLEIELSDEHINHLLSELLLAGSDTTTTAITWALADLVKNSHAMSKLREELGRKFGDETIKESEITGLPYLQSCVRESMRLHPPIPFLLPRKAMKTCKVMDYVIPKGSKVMINTWAMARDPSIWDDPSSFKPERFLDSRLDYKGSNFEYIPFGSGRRMCPGVPMAARIVPYVVASLVHSFDWFRPSYEDTSELNIDEVCHLALRLNMDLELIPKASKKM